MKTMIRILLLFVLACLSSLSLFPAPTLWIWYLAILATEYSWIGIIMIGASLIWPMGRYRFRGLSYFLALAGVAGFLVPIMEAQALSHRLPKEIQNAFGPMDPKFPTEMPAPYWWPRSLNMIGPSTHPQAMVYDSLHDLQLDYYPPATGFFGPRPWVLAIHGGSWKGGDRKQFDALYGLLSSYGYVVISIDYRLAPAYRFPATREDLRKAIGFVKDRAGVLGLDASQFFLLGHSAGAQMALLEAYSGKDTSLQGVIGFYGPADMVWGYQNPAKVYHSVKVLETYLGTSYSENPWLYDQSSPIHFVDAASPPSLLIHGEKDVLVAWGHSQRLGSRLQEEAIRWYLLSMPWATHGADFAYQGPSFQLSSYAILYFMGCYTSFPQS